jgi:hypothetical protein
MGTDSMIYIPIFIKIGSDTKKSLRGIHIQTHRQQCDFIRLLLFLKNKESRLSKRYSTYTRNKGGLDEVFAKLRVVGCPCVKFGQCCSACTLRRPTGQCLYVTAVLYGTYKFTVRAECRLFLMLKQAVHIVPCLRYLTTSDHQMYNAGSLMTPIVLVRLQNTPLNLLHSFISDSTSHHYNPSSYNEF